MKRSYDNDTYSRSETYKYPNCTVTVYFPDVTPEERKRRDQVRYNAAVNFARELIRVREERKKTNEQSKNIQRTGDSRRDDGSVRKGGDDGHDRARTDYGDPAERSCAEI